MTSCPFCDLAYTDPVKHAVRAHKNEKLVFTVDTVDAKHSVRAHQALGRLKDLALRNVLLGEDETWATILALTAVLLRDAKKETANATD